MRVVLVQPPQTQLLQPRAYISLGLAYIGAALEEKGIKVEILNLADESNLDRVQYPEADWYGVTCTTATYQITKKLMRYIRDLATVAVGGVQPSVRPRGTLRGLRPDVVIRGEAEHLFPQLVRGERVIQPIMDAGIIKNLDVLPLPARHLYEFRDVVDLTGIHGQEEGVPATTVITSRGCPYKCRFCCKGHRMLCGYRYRSSDSVREELVALVNDYGIAHVRFVDDEFTLMRERTANLMRAIDDLGLTWICITRADTLDRELVILMREAGCVEIHIGVESGSNRLLKMMNKNTTIESNLKGVRLIKEAGIRVKTYLMYGFPGETKEDREKTIGFVEQAQPDKFTLSYFTPLPGSDMKVDQRKWFYPDDNQEYQEYRRRISEALRRRG